MATAAPRPFQAQLIPPTEHSRGRIKFLHPGYPSSTNKLLSLPRVDRTADSAATFGVYHRIALLACQIIADNAFDTGRLTLDKAGQQPVDIPLDGILTENAYYFVVGDGGPDPYPVVPSFRDWEFPHDRLPDSWPQTSVSTNTVARCGITNFSFSIEDAHLVPKEEVLWYRRNEMEEYGRGLGDIHNPANILPLKSDIHGCFDNRGFVIVPKIAEAETRVTTRPSPHYVTHILSRDAAELWPTYHDTLVQYLDENSRPYLFARFAWAILLWVKPFITRGFSRRVIRVHTSGEDKMERKIELLSGSQLMDYYGGRGSSRATPIKKRSRADSAADEDDKFSESSGGDTDNMEDRNDFFWDMVDDWEERGRKRKRQTSSITGEDNQAHSLAEIKTRLLEGFSGGGDSIANSDLETASGVGITIRSK